MTKPLVLESQHLYHSSYMKGISAVLLCSALAQLSVNAVTFNVAADKLKDENGNPMSVNGLVVLVASTTDSTFNGPVPGAFTSGDDIIIGNQPLTLNSGFGPGAFLQGISQTESGNWGPNDPVALFWFPNLTSGQTPTAGTPYGFFTDATGHDGSAPWLTPADSSTVSLSFGTQDGTTLFGSGGGFFPPSAGNANLTVVPEPSQYAAAFGLACLGWAVVKRRVRRP